MAAQNLVLVTKLASSTEFKVSTTKIVYFKDLDTGCLLTYVNQRGQTVHTVVSESATAIDALTGGRTQAVTRFDNGETQYINSDRIFFLDPQTWGTRITYEINGGRGKYNQPPIFIDVTQSPSSINSAAGNTGIIYPIAGNNRWINGDKIDIVVHHPSISNDFQILYDSGLTEFVKLNVNSTGNAFSVGSGWA
jgi:hypothetical protein